MLSRSFVDSALGPEAPTATSPRRRVMYAGGAAASSPEEVVEETKGRSRSSSSVGSELVLDEPFPREDVSTPLPIQTLQTPTSERSRSPLLTGRSWSDAITDRMPGMNWFQSTDGAGPAVDTGEGGRSSNKNGGAADGRAGSNTCVTGNLRADEADGGGGAEDEAAGMSPLPDSIAALKEIFDCETIEIDAGAFNGVVFSTWDNILGPVNKLVWISKRSDLSDRFHEKLLPFIPTCTLNSEIMRDDVGLDNAVYKFFVLSEIEYVMPSFIFTSPIGGSGKSDLFAISLVMPIDKLSLYLPISHLVIGRMRSLIKKKQAILKKEGELSPSVFAQFTDLLNPFLSAISTMGIYLEPSSQLVDTVFYPGNETMFELTFLRKAISSHLQTGGVTIVVGHDAGRINMMIQTLAIFLTRDERRKSRFAFDAGTAQYAPDLCLQGIILAEGEFDIDASLVLQSESPSSVISLKDLTVRQTKERNEYKIIHGESFVDELRRLEGADPVDARPPMPKKHLFHYIQDKSLLVRDVVDRVFKPYPRHIRQAMLSHFYRGLYRKANVMIQYIDAVGAKPASPMSDEDIRVMRRDLELTCRQDFEILLAFADKLRPGMFDTLLGDPIIKEELMIGLLGAF